MCLCDFVLAGRLLMSELLAVAIIFLHFSIEAAVEIRVFV
jgi:hypothetical protein